jgi:hypothetical protein
VVWWLGAGPRSHAPRVSTGRKTTEEGAYRFEWARWR